MKKIFLVGFLFAFAYLVFVNASGRILLTNESCSSLSQVWLSNVDLTSQRIKGLNRPIKVTDGFSVRDTLNIYINLYWPKNESEHIVTLKYFTPKGYFYEEEKYPIAINNTERVRVQIPGYRFPKRVILAKSSPISSFNVINRKITSIPFPIGGTYISKNKLFGMWKVKIYVDNNKDPCATIRFNINK